MKVIFEFVPLLTYNQRYSCLILQIANIKANKIINNGGGWIWTKDFSPRIEKN